MNMNDPGWWQDQQGVWHHPQRGSWYMATDGRWYPVQRPGGTGRTLVWIIGIGALLGGCTFIVQEPVIALAIFFVGIPFALLVVWLMGLFMPSRR